MSEKDMLNQSKSTSSCYETLPFRSFQFVIFGTTQFAPLPQICHVIYPSANDDGNNTEMWIQKRSRVCPAYEKLVRIAATSCLLLFLVAFVGAKANAHSFWTPRQTPPMQTNFLGCAACTVKEMYCGTFLDMLPSAVL